MPIFVYKCRNIYCEHQWEALVISAKDQEHAKTCPVCWSDGKKLPVASNFSIKGFSEANGYSNKGGDK